MYLVGLATETWEGGRYTSMKLGNIFSNKNGDVALVAFWSATFSKDFPEHQYFISVIY